MEGEEKCCNGHAHETTKYAGANHTWTRRAAEQRASPKLSRSQRRPGPDEPIPRPQPGRGRCRPRSPAPISVILDTDQRPLTAVGRPASTSVRRSHSSAFPAFFRGRSARTRRHCVESTRAILGELCVLG